MCRSEHTDIDAAKNCLKACVREHDAQLGVDEAANKKVTRYRCSFCKRVYSDKIEAKACVDKCRFIAEKKEKNQDIDNKKLLDEQALKIQELAGLSAPPPKKAKQKIPLSSLITKRGTAYACNSCQSIFHSKEEATACAKRHLGGKPAKPYSQRIADAQNKINEKLAHSRKQKIHLLYLIRIL